MVRRRRREQHAHGSSRPTAWRGRRVHLPAVQSAAGSHGARERHDAAAVLVGVDVLAPPVDRRGEMLEKVGSRPPGRFDAAPPVGWRAAARRHRPRPRARPRVILADEPTGALDIETGANGHEAPRRRDDRPTVPPWSRSRTTRPWPPSPRATTDSTRACSRLSASVSTAERCGRRREAFHRGCRGVVRRGLGRAARQQTARAAQPDRGRRRRLRPDRRRRRSDRSPSRRAARAPSAPAVVRRRTTSASTRTARRSPTLPPSTTAFRDSAARYSDHLCGPRRVREPLRAVPRGDDRRRRPDRRRDVRRDASGRTWRRGHGSPTRRPAARPGAHRERGVPGAAGLARPVVPSHRDDPGRRHRDGRRHRGHPNRSTTTPIRPCTCCRVDWRLQPVAAAPGSETPQYEMWLPSADSAAISSNVAANMRGSPRRGRARSTRTVKTTWPAATPTRSVRSRSSSPESACWCCCSAVSGSSTSRSSRSASASARSASDGLSVRRRPGSSSR